MTKQDIPRNSSIDRRTVLGLLSGSLATLAGCSGGLFDDSGGDGGSASPPEEQSDYIEETSIEIVENGRQLALEVAVTDEIEPSSVSIITESGREFSSDYFSSGETRTRLSLTEGEDSYEPLPRGQHTLYLRGDDVETELPLELGTTFEFEEIVPGTEHEEIRDDSLGMVVRNVGQRTGAATRTILNGENKDSKAFEPIKPGETGIVEFTFLLADGPHCVKVEETTLREEELTVGFLWSDPVTVIQPIQYTDRFDSTGNGCKRTLAGEPEEVTTTPTKTEMET
ncbi:hypothetical protein SG26_20120 (plasmid) [Haloarcula sp. CBA1115]|uniref:hypothetical protein n=1 Tax=unclassified Haloarcula TaxID=2624677 RepID=UPI00059554F0|nr:MULTISPECIES: hypothetical protein [unclassified Haloarcula]AJF28055.1 hypothetical protein SG26_20120 [Haloarcula sp. CBA1115]